MGTVPSASVPTEIDAKKAFVQFLNPSCEINQNYHHRMRSQVHLVGQVTSEYKRVWITPCVMYSGKLRYHKGLGIAVTLYVGQQCNRCT